MNERIDEWPSPCPHCNYSPIAMESTLPSKTWAIFCNCTHHGQGTIGASRAEVVSNWNSLVESIILGEVDDETLADISPES